MDTLGEYAAQEFGFNPSEPRGFGGKWTKIGEAIKKAAGSPQKAIGERVVKGHGKAFDGKTVSQIGQEYNRGQHKLDDLPHDVRLHLAEQRRQRESLDEVAHRRIGRETAANLAKSADPANTKLNGYGKQFDGKTVGKIADEFYAGKHAKVTDLPDPVTKFIASGRGQRHADVGRNRGARLTARQRVITHVATRHPAFEERSSSRPPAALDDALNRAARATGRVNASTPRGGKGDTIGGKTYKRVGAHTNVETDTGSHRQTLGDAVHQHGKLKMRTAGKKARIIGNNHEDF